VVVALDQSQSMKSTGLKPEAILDFGLQIRQALGKDYKIEILGFGDETTTFASTKSRSAKIPNSFAFNGAATNPDGLRAWVDEQLGQNPVSAWVLVSDGQFNQGSDPVWLFEKDKAPIYTFVCGKSSSNQSYWSMAPPVVPLRVPAESSFEIETIVQGLLKEYAGLKVELLTQGLTQETTNSGSGWTSMDQVKVNPGSSNFTTKVRLKAKVGKAGIYAFKVKGVLEGNFSGSGMNPVSNQVEERLVYVEAVETLRRIQILALAPHPDLGVLRQILEETRNYRVELNYGIQGLQQAVTKPQADLYVLHQWPSSDAEPNSNNLLEQINSQKKPIWFLGGSRSNWNRWPGYTQGQSASNNPVSVSASFNKSWNAFALNSQEEQMIRRLPPLTVWESGTSTYPSSQTLLYRQIGQINSERPLWCIDYHSNPSKAYLWGEGLWRWRLATVSSPSITDNPTANNSFAIHQRLILQTISLLLGGRESDHFEAKPVKAVFNETENVVFEGSSRNAAGEFDNSASLVLKIYDAQQVLYEGAMAPSGMGYTLMAGRWASGNYRYSATLTRNGVASVHKGTFAVSNYNLESSSGLANQALMNQLTTLHGGLSHHASQGHGSGSIATHEIATNFAKHIRANPAIKPLSYQVTNLTEWLSWPSIWVLLGVLLGVEWVFFRALGGK
jgi:hypothetical protein